MDYHYITYLIVLTLSVTASITIAKVPAVIVFGDSSVDTGNNNFRPTIVKSNHPPYGRDFPGSKATGRFSNGRVPSDFLSEAFGLRPFVPAYFDTAYNISDFAVGVCFASAGSGYDSFTGQALNVIPLLKQLENYEEYQLKLRAYAGEKKANKIIREAFYPISIGTNDFLLNYYFNITTGRATQFTIAKYQDFLISLAEEFLRKLYTLGARKISLGGIPPIGCLPIEAFLVNRLFERDAQGCVAIFNDLAIYFNNKVHDLVKKLNKELHGIKLVAGNPYFIFRRIIRKPSLYGFEQVLRGCCGNGTTEVGDTCNLPKFPSTKTCQDANKYVFWDAFHPTQKTNQIITEHLLNTVFKRFR